MKIKKIRRMIREQLIGPSSGNFAQISGGFSVIQEYTQEAISAGRQTDADAILVSVVSDDSVLIAMIVGRSILFADGIREYLSNYHDGVADHANHCIEWLVDSAVDGLKKENACLIVLRDNESDRWRGFRGDKPMTLEEIKANGIKTLH